MRPCVSGRSKTALERFAFDQKVLYPSFDKRVHGCKYRHFPVEDNFF